MSGRLAGTNGRGRSQGLAVWSADIPQTLPHSLRQLRIH